MKPYTIVYWAGEPQFAIKLSSNDRTEACEIDDKLSSCVAELNREFAEKYEDPDGWDMSDLKGKCSEKGLQVSNTAPVDLMECWRFDSP